MFSQNRKTTDLKKKTAVLYVSHFWRVQLFLPAERTGRTKPRGVARGAVQWSGRDRGPPRTVPLETEVVRLGRH